MSDPTRGLGLGKAIFDYTPEAWMQQGNCAGHPHPEIWFPTPGDAQQNQRAIDICQTCPVRIKCLEYALRTDSSCGVWGALTETQRRQIKENGDAA